MNILKDKYFLNIIIFCDKSIKNIYILKLKKWF